MSYQSFLEKASTCFLPLPFLPLLRRLFFLQPKKNRQNVLATLARFFHFTRIDSTTYTSHFDCCHSTVHCFMATIAQRARLAAELAAGKCWTIIISTGA